MLRHDRPQFCGIDASASGVVVQLLIVDCPDREVAGLRMGKHKSAGRLSGRHHVGFGQGGADCLRYVEQFEQLGLQPTTENVMDINDRNPKLGIEAQKKILTENNLPVTDENIFILAACGEKGLAYLKGDKPMGIRYKEEKKASKKDGGPAAYTVTAGGKTFNVQVNGSKHLPFTDILGQRHTGYICKHSLKMVRRATGNLSEFFILDFAC